MASGQFLVTNDEKEACPTHIRKPFTYVCRHWMCNNKRICSDCAATSHLGHDYIDINLALSELRTNLNNFLSDSRHIHLAEMYYSLSALGAMKSRNISQHDRINDSLHAWETEVIMNIKRISQTAKDLNTKTMKENESLLHEYKSQLQNSIGTLESKLRACEDALQCDNFTELDDFSETLVRYTDIPTIPTLTSTFIHHDVCTKITNLISETTSVLQQEGNLTLPSCDPPCDSLTNLAKVDLLSDYTLVCPLSDTKAILGMFGKKTLDLISNGSVQRNVFSSHVRIHKLSHIANIHTAIYCSSDDRSIRQFKTNSLDKRQPVEKTLFILEAKPLSISCDDHQIVCGVPGYVRIYNHGGRSIASTEEGLVNKPISVTNCVNSGHIAVVDRPSDNTENEVDGCIVEGAYESVLILNNKLEALYQYITSAGCAPSQFLPLRVAYNADGHLVIGESGNGPRVCVLSKTHNAVFFIHSGLGCVNLRDVSFSPSGSLWILTKFGTPRLTSLKFTLPD